MIANHDNKKGAANMYAKIFSLALGILFVFTYSASAGTVSLQWNPNAEQDLAGYKLHYGLSSRTVGPYTGTKLIPDKTATSWALSLSPGVYYFGLKAYDTAGNESGFSNEVSAEISDIAPPGKPGRPTLVP